MCSLLNDDIRKKQQELDALVLKRRSVGSDLRQLQEQLSEINSTTGEKYRGAA
jgi:peptidoglycan hydrolase CwlO-like protein